MRKKQPSAAPPVATIDTTQRRKRKRPVSARQGDEDDDFLIGTSRSAMDRKSQYDWQVIDDPEACFQGGRFRWIDVQKSAEAQTWPVGIRFVNVHTGQVVLFDGLALLEQGPQPAAPVQVHQAKKPYPVYAWKKTVTMVADGPAVLIG